MTDPGIALSRLHERFADAMDAVRIACDGKLPERLARLHLPDSAETTALCEAWLAMLVKIGRIDWINVAEDLNHKTLLPRDMEDEELAEKFADTLLAGEGNMRYVRALFRALRLALPKSCIFPEEAYIVLKACGIKVLVPEWRVARRMNSASDLRLVDPRILAGTYGQVVVAVAKAGADRYVLSYEQEADEPTACAVHVRRRNHPTVRCTRIDLADVHKLSTDTFSDDTDVEQSRSNENPVTQRVVAYFENWLHERRVSVSVIIVAHA